MFKKYQKHILLSFYLMLGFIFQFPSVAMRFWLIEKVKLSPAQLMAMGGIAGIPWCLKPLYGFMSDSFPIFDRFCENVYIIADSNHGYKMLGVGKLVADEILGQESKLLKPFRFNRYAKGELHPTSNSPFPWS